jgi:hypothetical protein
VWEPILKDAEARYGLRFERISGIIARPQPAETMARWRICWRARTLCSGRAAQSGGPCRLAGDWPAGAGSGCRSGGSLGRGPSGGNWQAELWGRDEEAELRQKNRRAAFMAAAQFARLAQGVGGASGGLAIVAIPLLSALRCDFSLRDRRR